MAGVMNSCLFITIECHGKNPLDMEMNALAQASKFFGVPTDELTIALWSAESAAVDIAGVVIDWRGEIVVSPRPKKGQRERAPLASVTVPVPGWRDP